jgi:hypothetical protein
MRGRLTLRAVLPILVLLAACGRDDGDDEVRATSTTATTVDDAPSTSAGPTPSSIEAACPAVEPLNGATSSSADADGDGTADVVLTSQNIDGLTVQVELGAGGGARVAVPTFGVEGAGFVGATDLDGDDTDEVWVRTGAGASASILGLVDLADCQLVQATFDSGSSAEVPVGGTVGTAAGIACDPVALDDAADPDTDVTAFVATRSAEGTYQVTATEYAVEGPVLRQLRQSTAVVPESSPEFPRYGSFDCDGIAL